ncbi:polysaccharide deacetylase family protein [Flavobacterium sp. 14A]|uniref:polysaccharide deacetylase family protein n=1 Tax=Flavobacterium sp. 14A TaxID=2735896 RepID=UPI00156E55A4|nr:polysaccharide deacetylase family protein [Flavobacterium sp. 14A]NRT11690.1 peptidoglycan/xylan/chitin deacetylase (PgdA/CDA1 family) [Flavobacterium sp. 14A]
MNLYWVKTNAFIRKLFSNYIWLLPNNDKKIYLTFDDGPIPEITEWILEELRIHNAKATFFCIGKNVEANPELFEKIVTQGHSIGNHTHNHLNGWKSNTSDYLENFQDCEKTLARCSEKLNYALPKFFRPPYGKIKKSQAKKIKNKGYKIIMWDIVSGDFDRNISQEKCLNNIIKNIEAGSIVVFHDSLKAYRNLKYALPKVLAYLQDNNFKCVQLDTKNVPARK